MIVVDSEQRSDEWFAARRMKPTASEFHNILTPTGKPTTGVKTVNYRNKLLAEWLVGGEVESYTNQWMQRGIEMEDEARDAFRFITDNEVTTVGLCLTDNNDAGCSPDGLIGNNSGLEIKCPAPHTHVQYLLDDKLPTDYIPQIQGSMFVTGRKYWWFMSYHPGMDPLIKLVKRDDEYINTLSTALESFIADLLDQRQALLSKGCTPPAAA